MFGISDNVSYPWDPWSAPWDHVDALCDAASWPNENPVPAAPQPAVVPTARAPLALPRPAAGPTDRPPLALLQPAAMSVAQAPVDACALAPNQPVPYQRRKMCRPRSTAVPVPAVRPSTWVTETEYEDESFLLALHAAEQDAVRSVEAREPEAAVVAALPKRTRFSDIHRAPQPTESFEQRHDDPWAQQATAARLVEPEPWQSRQAPPAAAPDPAASWSWAAASSALEEPNWSLNPFTTARGPSHTGGGSSACGAPAIAMQSTPQRVGPTAATTPSTLAARGGHQRAEAEADAQPRGGGPSAAAATINAAGELVLGDGPTGAPVCVEAWLTAMLRPHQREGVVFLFRSVMGAANGAAHTGAILADHMGLGKTLQTLALIHALRCAKLVGAARQPLWRGGVGGASGGGGGGIDGGGPLGGGKVLLVCPASLTRNWSSEIDKFLGRAQLPYMVLGEGGRKPVGQAADFCSRSHAGREVVLILSYEHANTPRVAEVLRGAPPFALLVCDEAHRLKNRRSKGYMGLDALQAPRRLLLTGTPLQNDLTEFFALLSFANPGFLGSAERFASDFVRPIKAGIAKEASQAERAVADAKQRQLKARCANMLLRRTAETNAAYAPPLTELVVCCKLTALQKELYLALLDSKARAELSALGGSSAGQPGGAKANTALQLRYVDLLGKACSHPTLLYFDHRDHGEKSAAPPPIAASVWPAHYNPLDESAMWEWSGKMRVAHRLLASLRPSRVVVASNFARVLDLMQSVCEQSGWATLRLDGATPTNQRVELVERFNGGREAASIFLLSAKAGGSGLNLVGASHLILLDPAWNPASDRQVIGRVHRPGSAARRVVAYRLLTTGTLEEKIFQRQLLKTDYAEGAVDTAESQSHRHYTSDELAQVFQFDTTTFSSTYQLQGLPQNLSSGDAHLDAAVSAGWVSHVHEQGKDPQAGTDLPLPAPGPVSTDAAGGAALVLCDRSAPAHADDEIESDGGAPQQRRGSDEEDPIAIHSDCEG